MKKLILIIFAGIVALMGCHAQTTKSEANMSKKALVVFFSHAGENYSVGNNKGHF